jgi:AcrR family transcriptional regulator
VARWQPGARQRLVAAAVDLFAEQGYDATTVAQIAERAGVTKSTFFRHFSDKRELLVAGQETLSRLLVEGIHDAAPDATPLEAVASGLRRAAAALGPSNREMGSRLHAVIAASTELQKRDALKHVGMATAMTTALCDRGVAKPVAVLASELGVLAFKQGCARWFEQSGPETNDLADLTVASMHELHAAAKTLS